MMFNTKKINRLTVIVISRLIVLMLALLMFGVFSTNVLAQTENPQKDYEDFDPANFDESSIDIDNEWFPLMPWTQFIYEGTTVEDGESTPHRVVFTVTGLTKVIGGVRTVVCWDQDYADGELEESEIVFFAQDKDGTVWHLGQYPEEYEEGKFVDAPCWIHGIEDAVAGIIMKANPQPGTQSYSQGWAPSVDWTDRAFVYQMGVETTVPAGNYTDVLVMDETSRSEPDAHQLKYYARGVGNVRVGWRGEGEQTQETLELMEVYELVLGAKDEALSEVLKLEKHAYEVSEEVYGQTLPVEDMSGDNDGPQD